MIETETQATEAWDSLPASLRDGRTWLMTCHLTLKQLLRRKQLSRRSRFILKMLLDYRWRRIIAAYEEDIGEYSAWLESNWGATSLAAAAERIAMLARLGRARGSVSMIRRDMPRFLGIEAPV
jgi:hypothetical protein